jgi:dTDP-4-amino-4,6-dideoxygalactose transaminase
MIDAAQSYGSYYKGKACGTYGDLATFSFHETKNISCGEGGALVINNEDWLERAHYLQEKGTDRRLVLYGQKTKYHWVDIGSSYLLSDILAAVLLAQLENEHTIMALRKIVTDAYLDLFKAYKDQGSLYYTPYEEYQNVNSHAFWVVFDTSQNKERFITELASQQVFAYIGYMPLHSSPMGIRLGNKPGSLPITEDVASRIVRLPLYADLASEGLNHCIDIMGETLRGIYG